MERSSKRFVGPLAGLLSGQGIWRVGWRAEMRRCGGETQVIEDLPDDGRALDHGDHLHRAPATRIEERIDLVHHPDKAGPSRLSSTQARAEDR